MQRSELGDSLVFFPSVNQPFCLSLSLFAFFRFSECLFLAFWPFVSISVSFYVVLSLLLPSLSTSVPSFLPQYKQIFRNGPNTALLLFGLSQMHCHLFSDITDILDWRTISISVLNEDRKVLISLAVTTLFF